MDNVLNNTTNAQMIPTIVAQKALAKFGSYMNLAKTVARDFEYTTAKEGQTISIPKRGVLVANDKVAGSEFTPQNPTATNVSVTLNKHKEVTIILDDVTAVLENQNSLDGYAEDAAIALAEAVETAIAELHPSLTSTITFDASSATTIDTSILKVRKYFVDQKVPRIEPKFAYVDSSVMNALLSVDKFSRADALGRAGVIEQGQPLNIYGINFFESQNVGISGSPVAYHNLAYTKNAFILASRPLPEVPAGYGAVSTVINDEDINMGLRVVSSYDTKLGGMQITLDLLFGVAILDQRRVVEVESF